VPGVTDLKLTGSDGSNAWPRGPNPTGGFQLDARVSTLQEQALGALLNHAQAQNPPPQRMLDDLSSFQRVLFTNGRVRALSEAIDEGVTPLPDADPPLNALEQQGKAVFIRACAQCHGGAGQSTPQPPVVRFHDISSQCPRPVDTATPARFNFKPCPPRLARNVRTYEITLPTGAKIRRTSSDPGRALLTGFAGVGPPAQDDWNKLDAPGLRGLRNTAPYFHNNSADTLEEVVDHYIEFFKRVPTVAAPGVVPPSVALGRFVNGPVAVPSAQTTVATVAIPDPGNYVIWGKAYLTTSLLAGTVTCRLEAGSNIDESLTYVAADEPATLSLMVLNNFTAAGNVNLSCSAPTQKQANFVKITALRVANLTNSG